MEEKWPFVWQIGLGGNSLAGKMLRDGSGSKRNGLGEKVASEEIQYRRGSDFGRKVAYKKMARRSDPREKVVSKENSEMWATFLSQSQDQLLEKESIHQLGSQPASITRTLDLPWGPRPG